jgi:hypothetical protein
VNDFDLHTALHCTRPYDSPETNFSGKGVNQKFDLRRLHIHSKLNSLSAPFLRSNLPYFRHQSAAYVVALFGRDDAHTRLL